MLNKVIILVLLIFTIRSELYAQPFVVDTTYKPYFKVQDASEEQASLNDIWENSKTGIIFTVGEEGLYSSLSNGTRNTAYLGTSGRGAGIARFVQVNDTSFMQIGSGKFNAMDNAGNTSTFWLNWRDNYRNTVSCATGIYPFFFENGSSLMSNSKGFPGSCLINNTYPHRYIVKVDSLGNWDSTFVPDTNYEPRGFLPYDSSRIWVFGRPRDLTHYDSIPINGICRIYHDGTIDTTFNSPLESLSSNYPVPLITEKDGGFFMRGPFILNGDGIKKTYLARFHSNGDLDSTFVFDGIEDTTGNNHLTLVSIVPTFDGGYILGGSFNKYQGVKANSIVKVDSVGNIQSQYFTSIGPDSSTFLDLVPTLPASVTKIIASEFGGYYVVGDWRYWDGKPSQPIVRLIDAKLVGIEEEYVNELRIDIYPNPTREFLNISIKEGRNIKGIQLYDLMGRMHEISIDQLNGNNFELNLTTVPRGLYILGIDLKSGVQFSKKVLKQ